MRKVLTTLLIVMMAIAANAQTGLKKVYNEEINPLEQIDQALAKAKATIRRRCCASLRTGHQRPSRTTKRQEKLVDAGVVVEFRMEGGDELVTLSGGYDVAIELSKDFHLG